MVRRLLLTYSEKGIPTIWEKELWNIVYGQDVYKRQDYIQGRNQYISYLTSTTIHSFRGYKVGLDCANGAASSIAKTVFEMLGAKTYMLHDEPDGLNINVDSVSYTHLLCIMFQ